MEIEAPQPTGKGPAERFTGDVWVDAVAQQRPQPHRMAAGIVRFAPGARTAWHVHALGQTLRVTDGTALVQARGGRPSPSTPARPSTPRPGNGTGTEPPSRPS
jgi:quercetin dioxygenase-like cupin family protein